MLGVAPFPNATKEMRVPYFTAAKDAKLKNPESLTLNVGNCTACADRPLIPDTRNIPFTRHGYCWEAIAPLEKQHAAYAIFAGYDRKAAEAPRAKQ